MLWFLVVCCGGLLGGGGFVGRVSVGMGLCGLIKFGVWGDCMDVVFVLVEFG